MSSQSALASVPRRYTNCLDVPFGEILDYWEEATDGGKDIEAVRALALFDRFFLLVQILGRVDALHPWLYVRCREVERDPDGYLDLWAREHYKSTIITFAGVIQEVLKNPEITVGIFSHTKDIAKSFLRQIKMELEGNDRLKKLFPNILYEDPAQDSVNWSLDNGITVKRKTNPKEATIEAHGLVDGMPTSKHFALLVYNDVVTEKSVYTPEQIAKTTAMWELSDNLGAIGGRKWHEGTRYCTIAGTKILMSDWSHKKIEDVRIGETVIGWRQDGSRRMLVTTTVMNNGCHHLQPVNKYTFEHGRSVTCTPDHKWWRGAHGGGDEYAPLCIPANRNRRKDGIVAIGDVARCKGLRRGLSSIKELLVPTERDESWEAGWLAGMFDGEGTTKKNKNHPSGMVCITQTMHNPEIIDEIRRVLSHRSFKWTEAWLKAEGRERMLSDRCVFGITGGWRERYRFLMQMTPCKTRALAPTLLGQLQTESRSLLFVEAMPPADVFWLETGTGNYVADGFCSKNSYADTYESIMKRGAVIPRVYPATTDGTITGTPVFFSKEVWERKVIVQGEATIACHCAGTSVLMGNWTYKRIEDVVVGDTVVGFDPGVSKGNGVKLTRAKVLAVNKKKAIAYQYRTDKGSVVECTPDHKWWSKRSGTDGHSPYAALGKLCKLNLKSLYRVSNFHGWTEYGVDPAWHYLAGIMDGEGSFSGNRITITQSKAHNPEVHERIGRTLDYLGLSHSLSERAAHGIHKGSTQFIINGGRHVRHRILLNAAPAKQTKILDSLYCMLKGKSGTERERVINYTDIGVQTVYNIQTESGNYIANGFASKNCQMLQNPLAGHQRMFEVTDLQAYEVRPQTLAVYIVVDPARSKKTESANTAMAVIGIDYANNKYLLDGFNHKMDLMERWVKLANLYVKWKTQTTGVQAVYVGYESFGAQADLDYFNEQMKVTGVRMDIKELAWPREGGGSKIDRVQRLGPDFRTHKFFLPYPTDEKKYTSNQLKMLPGYGYRVSKSIVRRDENENLYDLSEQFKMQVHFFPFGGKVDLIDAISRIYDMEPMRPSLSEPRYAEPEFT